MNEYIKAYKLLIKDCYIIWNVNKELSDNEWMSKKSPTCMFSNKERCSLSKNLSPEILP